MSGVILISVLLLTCHGFNKHIKVSEHDALIDILHSFNIDDNDGMWSFRSYNGWGNNIDPENLEFGASGTPALRLMEPDYKDGIAQMYDDRLSAREISNTVSFNKTLSNRKTLTGLSNFCWQWGQFIDHDFVETPQNMNEMIKIKIPETDNMFEHFEFIQHSRSTAADGTGINNIPRNHINEITSFLDGSNVYGSDWERVNELRSYKDGKLKVTPKNTGDLLPLNLNNIFNAGGNREDFFVAGDIRANEQTGLTAIHTIFMREHNRLCNKIKEILNINDDELIFEFSKAIIAAQIQHITWNEFLPALFGEQMNNYFPKYKRYNKTMNPSITSLFSTAAFRVGHSMVVGNIPRRSNNCGDSVYGESISLNDAFFNTKHLLDNSNIIDNVGEFIMGLHCTKQNDIDTFAVEELRNHLFEGVEGVGFPVDLISLNIDRARDHGIPLYNKVRKHFGLYTKTEFNNFLDNTADALKYCYDNDINKVELFVAGLAEEHLYGSNLGETFSKIISDQFIRIRDGDRYWYERYLNGNLLKWIKQTRLKDVIERNTNIIGINNWAMFVPEQQPVRKSNNIDDLDIKFSLLPQSNKDIQDIYNLIENSAKHIGKDTNYYNQYKSYPNKVPKKPVKNTRYKRGNNNKQFDRFFNLGGLFGYDNQYVTIY